MTWEKDQVLQKYIDRNLPTGKVRRSCSATGALILLVREKDGSLRVVVEYSELNCLTISHKYLLPLIKELRDQPWAGKCFTTLNLQNASNLIRVGVGHEWKTAFRTDKGLFKYTVMAFALMNAPATFQEMMDTMNKDAKGCVWYMNDILIDGAETGGEYQAFVEKML